jgi:hypothetical protein
MRRLVIGLLVLVVGTLAAAGLAPMGTAPAPPAAAKVSEICDYLVDGGGVGSALSATPGTPPPPSGQTATMRTTGAWNVCYGTSDLEITLTSDFGFCLDGAEGDGLAHWEQCDNTEAQE